MSDYSCTDLRREVGERCRLCSRRMPTSEAFPGELAAWIDTRGYTLDQAANRLAVSPQSVTRWRNGTAIPSRRRIRQCMSVITAQEQKHRFCEDKV